MTSLSKVLLVTKEDAVAETVRSILDPSGRMSLAGVYHELSELRIYLEHTSAAAVMVDIDEDPSRILDDLHIIIASYPKARFVVISSRMENHLILGAMHAGARHFLLKKSIASELVEVLQRLVSDGVKKKGTSGSIISVFSASGGCGATTVVLNLANELRLRLSKPVLVVDLDCYYGTAATYLGISGHYGIADVLSHKGPVDVNLIRSSACNYMEDFDVLISPASVEHLGPKSLRYHNLIDVLLACREAYRYTIIDAPRVSESVAADLATVSKVVLIVFQLTVKDIKNAQSMVSFLSKSGVARKKMLPLVNRFKKRGPLVGFEDGEKALGLGPIPRIRSDFRNATNSLNLGQPLAQAAPWSGLRYDFQKLVTQIYAYETNGDSNVDV